MATANTTQNIPRAVKRKLSGLRSKLTGWMLVHGIGRWLLVVLGILAADMILDRLFKMDWAQRMVVLVAMVVGAVIYFGWKVIKPLLLRPNDQALIYEVESKNPELKESLLSGYQLAGQENLEAMGYSRELADATIQKGLATAEKIDFAKSLDQSQNAKNWMMLLAGVAASCLLAVGVSQTDFLKTWFNRNIMLLDDQWPQSTYLEIAGVTDGKLILPRGNDHRQLVVVTEESPVTEVDVSIEIENPGGRTIHPMKPTGKLNGREHMFMFHNVSSTFRFRASGGDDVTSWVNVELVEPPNIIELEMESLLPEYTGISSLPLIGNGPHAVLVGSKLGVRIKTNKPLELASIKLGEDLIPMKSMGSPDEFSCVIGSDESPLIGGEYEFELTDASGLKSTRRSKFKITTRDDGAPKVRANLLGISGLVSARAMLPTSYQAADEYGLTIMAFDMNWKTSNEDDKPGKLEKEFAKFDLVDGMPVRNAKDVALLDLLPLNMPIETSFRFSVAATDNQPSNPATGRSQEFLLRIVSDEELRGDLLRREIEQRKAFDQAYQAQMELATELQALAVRRKTVDVEQDEFDSRREAALIGLVRGQKAIGTSIDRIASRFEEFLVEVKNNRLDEAENEYAPEQRIETRFDEKIIRPIRNLDQELIAAAARQMDDCRRSIRDASQLEISVEETALIHQRILDEMRNILNAMNDSEGFQSLVNEVLQLRDEGQRQLGDIEKKMKPQGIFEDDNDDIFDDK